MNYTENQLKDLERMILEFVESNRGSITRKWKKWDSNRKKVEQIKSKCIQFEYIDDVFSALMGPEPEKYKKSSSVEGICMNIFFRSGLYSRRVVREMVRNLHSRGDLERVIGGGYRMRNHDQVTK